MAAKLDLIIEQGSTFSLTLEVQGSDGTLRDLSGYSARMKGRVRKEDAPTLFSLVSPTDIEIPVAGFNEQVTVTIDDSVTEAYTWRRGVYDLEIESPTGEVERLIEGSVTLSTEVTRP